MPKWLPLFPFGTDLYHPAPVPGYEISGNAHVRLVRNFTPLCQIRIDDHDGAVAPPI